MEHPEVGSEVGVHGEHAADQRFEAGGELVGTHRGKRDRLVRSRSDRRRLETNRARLGLHSGGRLGAQPEHVVVTGQLRALPLEQLVRESAVLAERVQSPHAGDIGAAGDRVVPQTSLFTHEPSGALEIAFSLFGSDDGGGQLGLRLELFGAICSPLVQVLGSDRKSGGDTYDLKSCSTSDPIDADVHRGRSIADAEDPHNGPRARRVARRPGRSRSRRTGTLARWPINSLRTRPPTPPSGEP